MFVTLPWPPKELNPNQRRHWATKAKAAKGYRNRCSWLAAIAARSAGFEPGERVSLAITFKPPDKRKRDRDNCIAAFKAGQDGLADAFRVDDSELAVTYEPFGEPVYGGAVEVVVS